MFEEEVPDVPFISLDELKEDQEKTEELIPSELEEPKFDEQPMPFRSKAQRRWFHWAETEGLLDKGTARRWEKHTKKKGLPERVGKKADIIKRSFAEGFFNKVKRLEERGFPHAFGPRIPADTLKEYTDTMNAIFEDMYLAPRDKSTLIAQLRDRPSGVPLTPYNNIATLLGAGLGGASSYFLTSLLGAGLLGKALGTTLGVFAGRAVGSRMFSRLDFGR